MVDLRIMNCIELFCLLVLRRFKTLREGNKALFIRVWKPLPRRVLKP